MGVCEEEMCQWSFNLVSTSGTTFSGNNARPPQMESDTVMS